MRSTPALAACSKTRREPSTLSSRVASPAERIANARWTTASAPLTSVAHAAVVLDVALAVLGLLPAAIRGVERPARHAHDALDRARALERGHDRDAEVAGRAGHRHRQTLRRHRGGSIRSAAAIKRVSTRDSHRPLGGSTLSAAHGSIRSARTVSRPRRSPPGRARPSREFTASAPAPVAIPSAPAAAATSSRPSPVRIRSLPDPPCTVTSPPAAEDHVSRPVPRAGSRRPPRSSAGPRPQPPSATSPPTDAIERVAPGPAEETVSTRLAEQRVAARAAEHDVLAGSRIHHVVSGAGIDRVGTGSRRSSGRAQRRPRHDPRPCRPPGSRCRPGRRARRRRPRHRADRARACRSACRRRRSRSGSPPRATAPSRGERGDDQDESQCAPSHTPQCNPQGP